MASIAQSDVFPLHGPFEDTPFLLSRDGKLWAVMATTGRDPDGLSLDNVIATCGAAHVALQSLPAGADIQQWYCHTKAALPVELDCGHPVVDRLIQARHRHLEAKSLYRSRIYTAIGIPTEGLTGQLSFSEFITTALMATTDKDARARLRSLFSARHEKRYILDKLRQAAQALSEVVEIYRQRWAIYADTELLSPSQSWRLVRALAELSPEMLDAAPVQPGPHWYAAALHGRVSACQVSSVEMLKSEAGPRFARLGSVTRLVGSVRPGFWATAKPPVLNVDGEFLLAINARGLSPFQRSMRFKRARDKLERAQFSAYRAMLQKEKTDMDRDRARRYNEQMVQVDAAEAVAESEHSAHIMVVALGKTGDEAARTATSLDAVLSQIQVPVVWENPGIFETYTALQLGSRPYAPRELPLNASKLAATGLHYAHSTGAFHAEIRVEHPPLAILETIDGQAFGYSPFVGEKSTVLGVGPARTGKTVAKNVMASLFPRFGGDVVCLDFDEGSETLAHLYGDDGALFTGFDSGGMNPFAMPPKTSGYSAHLTRLLLIMMAGNDDPAMRGLDAGEQAEVDDAIAAVLALPPELQTLDSFATHVKPSTANKLKRWLRKYDGRYGFLLDNAEDRIGQISRRMTAFNLSALRDDSAARAVVVAELLWRVTSAFENPARRHVPKRFYGDEAHLLFNDPTLASYIVTKARQWPKHNAGLELWNHQVSEFQQLEGWDALRTSASTFLFTATPDADTDAYVSAFHLNPADVDAIRQLTPQRDVYLVQPITGLRKHLVLSLDDQAKIWTSSSPQLTQRRNQLIAEHGFAAAMDTLLRQAA